MIEIEKKYRLSREQHARVLRRLAESGAVSDGREFEENTLYAGGNLNGKGEVLRLRRVGARAILTYKRRFASTSAIKHQREEETAVEDPRALENILEALGYKPALVYEKWRATWHLSGAEVVVDELPFGLFMEIEGDEKTIVDAERLLGLEEVEAEMATYPALARQYGERRGEMVEARFQRRLPDA